jgi:hypothetical protein
MTWWGAKAWVNYLDATNYGGSNQWALPTTVDNIASVGYPDGGAGNPAQSSSQMAQLFYGGLGLVADSVITTTHNGSYALFSNLQSSPYWSATEYSANPSNAWNYGTYDGSQYPLYKGYHYYALAVTPGKLAGGGGSAASADGPAPLWSLGALGMGLLAIAGRRFTQVR